MAPFLNPGFQIQKHNDPFLHWQLQDVMPMADIPKLLSISYHNRASTAVFKRTEHNDRLFLTEGTIADRANSQLTRSVLSTITGVNLTNARLRLELCHDAPGFSLEPHVDIPEKLITLQIYLAGEKHCGTNLYPKTIDCIPNTAWLIKNTPDTIHGFDYREFNTSRVSLILNYVTDDWWDVDQLYHNGTK